MVKGREDPTVIGYRNRFRWLVRVAKADEQTANS